MKDWIRRNKIVAIAIAVVVLGILVAIGTGVDLPGHREVTS